ncbi:MAG: hypothetical protein HY320_12295 [Armatimonadetes bacterium]|nr:hypothetical protein [Armatimonadota bacterium]
MRPEPYEKDLVVLLADRDAEAAVVELLQRAGDMGIRLPAFDTHTHPMRDPGCFRHSHEFLRAFHQTHEHALVLFDLDGCGQERRGREKVEREAETRLAVNGWDDRAAVVVIAPELEAWVWSDSPAVDRILGWEDREPGLREWLRQRRMIRAGQPKPRQPKETFLEALRVSRSRRRSAALYSDLAQVVDFAPCIDPAFLKLKMTLQAWFPIERRSDV